MKMPMEAGINARENAYCVNTHFKKVQVAAHTFTKYVNMVIEILS